ncbi:MAG: quinone-dependent dihydroorotate dehydrogenase [Gammaproteobacteria bacterium]|nr:quinone-dependent dihydroorotate dehydrogenase [Gammaproteobacteria bacterium]
MSADCNFMMSFLYPLMRFLLFFFDAEKSHDFTLRFLAKIEKTPFRFLICQKVKSNPVEVLGIKFPNQIGLAAGLDKNGVCIDAFAAMGFGHIEVGTVTPRPQSGNPKPRMFRLKTEQAVINRFGFNNLGVDHLIENVKQAKYQGVLGINIGKNFDTPVDQATEDYLICLRKVYPYASYIAVNISSPNTQNLRQLQFGQALEELLNALKQEQKLLKEQHNKYVPVLIKIAPDLSEDEAIQLARTFIQFQVDGVIATNTTFSREGVEASALANEQGGLSGKPLLAKSNHVLKIIADQVNGKFPIIGVGGIASGTDAVSKINAGASLVQVYTGFIYKGPALIKSIAKALV